MASSEQFSDIETYARIKRGLWAIIVFSGILLATHLATLGDTILMEYNDDSVVNGELEDDDKPSPCSWGDDYDAELCFEETKAQMIMVTLLQIVLYSLPVYGLIEIYFGINNLSNRTNLEENKSEEKEVNLSKSKKSDKKTSKEKQAEQLSTIIEDLEDEDLDSNSDGLIVIIITVVLFIVYSIVTG